MGNEESKTNYAVVHAIGYKNINLEDNQKINMQKANSKPNPQQQQQQQQQSGAKSGQNSNNSNKTLNNPQQSKTNPNNSNNNQKNNNNNNLKQNTNLSVNSKESFGTGRIARRQLWWHESESERKVHLGSLPKFEAHPKVDHKSNWSPTRSSKKIETVKLNWKAEPVLNTKENINYLPGGGNKKYPTEHLEWNASHKVDSGFIYEFE